MQDGVAHAARTLRPRSVLAEARKRANDHFEERGVDLFS
jgi:hypothetical protein